MSRNSASNLLLHPWNFVRAPFFGRGHTATILHERNPIRAELFSVERLEQHAISLATAQTITPQPHKVFSLHRRLDQNAKVLREAWRESALEAAAGQEVVPAAEWLLDNYHLVEAQIREIRIDLPEGYYRLLPKLESGPFAGYPRVFGIAWAFVAHTDSHFDPEVLRRFLVAYQSVQVLTIGELWAIAITLRIVLVENLRRLADQMTQGRARRREADLLIERVSVPGQVYVGLLTEMTKLSQSPLSEVFAAHLARRLRDRDPKTNPLLGWLEERLAAQSTSIDTVVHHALERLGASNVTLRNVITAMRKISETDWSELFESVSLVEAKLQSHPDYAAMDFASRNLYRGAVEVLARGAPLSEIEIAQTVIAKVGQGPATRAQDDPGWYLIAAGRPGFEREIAFRPPLPLRLRRWGRASGLTGYLGAIGGLTAALSLVLYLWLGQAAGGLGLWWSFAMILPLSAVAVAVCDHLIRRGLGPTLLPGLDLRAGVPSALRSLVVVPVLITSSEDLLARLDELEVHYLSGALGDLTFMLLTDGPDALVQTLPQDAQILQTATDGIATLNRKYPPGPAGPRFLHLHRSRRFNPSEGVWMGWERKRGKLHALNLLLRGDLASELRGADGAAPWVPQDVRYVITLDADTRLPRDTAAQLIGKIAHPLNRPVLDQTGRRVTQGYGILQPHITPSLSSGGRASLYLRATAGPGGMDPYASANSDLWQDLFGEGSFTGKGIYDIDAFSAALHDRVPENSLLSHDLLEGIYARAGLASDVELVEAFPERHDLAAQREHRWMRGDWQLLRWLVSRDLPAIGRVKMADTLRRSLLMPGTLAAVGLSWLQPLPAWPLAISLATLGLPILLPLLAGLMPRPRGLDRITLWRQRAWDLQLGLLRFAMAIALLADSAWRAGDAILRSLWRMAVSRRHLLQWTTAAQAAARQSPTLWRLARLMAPGMGLGLGLVALALSLAPQAWPFILPFGLLWLGAPVMIQGLNRPPPLSQDAPLLPQERRDLQRIARATWRYFETFVTATHHHLPPDNHQETPEPLTAPRTSPTNMGLYLLSCVAAHNFGWISLRHMVERLEATFATLEGLEKQRGHFYNWYDTQEASVLEPAYVSSVDSGNLAGHLITLANACEAWAKSGPHLSPTGVLDALSFAREAQLAIGPEQSEPLHEIERLLTLSEPEVPIWPGVVRLAARALAALPHDPAHEDLRFWIEALRAQAAQHLNATPAPDLEARLLALGAQARAMALAMDFAFLFDLDRKLLSIGWSRPDNSLDKSCYDLLASEARLASLFAIAKGDVPVRHWFRLGRAALPQPGGGVLISWSGSMFEYLMPALVMDEPWGSVLDQTNREVVLGQQRYGAKRAVPWGVSESGFNARDLNMNYQYSTFGIPGFGLRRGFAADMVIAPYATGLAAMFAPRAALQNFAQIAQLGGLGRYGFYEALDFTPSRVPEGERVAVVQSYMAHHQGMTIVAIANALEGGQMRQYFHSEPMIRATELLLQERVPRDVPAALPLPAAMTPATEPSASDMQRMAQIQGAVQGPALCHLLSNGRYNVMLSARGRGYSRWGEIALTRWHPDPTTETGGQRLWLRDLRNGRVLSIEGDEGARQREAEFFEDRVFITRHDAGLTTSLEVLISGEDDAEVRHVRITSKARRSRDIELTSYAELVLTTPATEDAHPAFAKMFVQTEFLPEYGALIATRRPRTPEEPQVWLGHFMVTEGALASGITFETDRAAFVGRDNDLVHCAAMAPEGRLTGAIGTVLDPVFALRQSLKLPPGQTVSVAFWTVVADSREALIDLIDRHHDQNAFERAKTLAWTQAQVQLRHLGISTTLATQFQHLVAPILIPDRRFRVPPAQIAAAAGKQSALWPLGVSGDLPLVVLRISDEADLARVTEILLAQDYWHEKWLAVDVVILNEHPASYVQNLQLAIEAAIRRSPVQAAQGAGRPGAVHALRADLLPPEAQALLLAVARVVIVARRGTLAEQIAAITLSLTEETPISPAPPVPPLVLTPAQLAPPLEFFNGWGGFDQEGRDYVTWLTPDQPPPTPWINVIANDGFGFHVSTSGAGSTWAENSRENRLTPWSNDPVSDPISEVIYLQDEATGEVFSPTPRPLRRGGYHLVRHGFGYSQFEHETAGLSLVLRQFVPLKDPVKLSQLTLRNLTGQMRHLRLVSYAELVMGLDRKTSLAHLVTEQDPQTQALFARNPWNTAFPDRVSFMDQAGGQSEFTTDRTAFLGREGGLARPAALHKDQPLDGQLGAGLDPCLALGQRVTLGPYGRVTLVLALGQCASTEAAQALVSRLRQTDIEALFAQVQAHWAQILGSIQVKTPDRALDIMLNGWLPYQTLACRMQARAAFWQASGAYGFRDQLQDGMALTWSQPARVRAHLLRAAARQFVEGDVQHWWLPHSGQGVRTQISDDCVWLGHAVADYLGATGDLALLDQMVPYLEGPRLAPQEHDAFYRPTTSTTQASVYAHCVLGLERALSLTGPLGMPLMGTGDWNDGMNRVGQNGLGESVWLGWFLLDTLAKFAPFVQAREPDRAALWQAKAKTLRASIEREAWDGGWYRRATFDDGTWIGASTSPACRIDAIAQSWAVLSGQADPARAALAMQAVARELIQTGPDLALLFTPPFDGALTGPDPGYLAAYPPGLRENGGQYSHAAMWTILARAGLGDGAGAAALFAQLNPINHALTAADAQRYKVEPYVIAADVYSQGSHAGRGGWTWYTGSAAWMYRAGIEGILGLRQVDGHLVIAPNLPPHWPGFTAQLHLRDTQIDLTLRQISSARPPESEARLDDGVAQSLSALRVPLEGGSHHVEVVLHIKEGKPN